ncbi:MAG TPA: hypothetical protein VEU62_13525 [Bryobacterales bacterium]|nr:hypothetical protein [Bryobacterales bacterium]
MTCASACGIRSRAESWRAPLLLTVALLLAGAAAAAPVETPEAGGWRRILASVGLDLVPGPPAFTILEGDSPQAREFGFRPTSKTVRVASVEELRDPELEVVWEKPLVLPVYELPEGARVFAREKWTGAPLVAGFRRGGRAVLWTAAGVGEKGYERFPYLLQALADLGVTFPFRGARTWAFFDYSYRMRADSDFLARRWRQEGIAAIHVAAWHFYDPDPWRDDYLKKLIEACHRQGVLVYAWLELPHVSEKFWDDHPAWREKTAILQDAHLDWRKLMNLADPACSRAVEAGLRALANRFDWDGVNLAELYFESLYGPSDPQRFTPMNEAVRAEFRRQAGFDPLELFERDSPHHWQRDPVGWKQFAEYRASLALRLQQHWLEQARAWKPDLDLVLTHIDDRFDARMKENLGADAAAVLPLLSRLDFTFVIEDPATVWNLGPERYPEIARRYAALTPRQDKLAVDINIVERYQDVYPTKKQTGVELFQLAHIAAGSFSRVMLYFEQSIARPDGDLLAAASAAVKSVEQDGSGWLVATSETAGVRWRGPVRLDGRPWPATDGETVWIPAGSHRIESDASPVPVRLLQLNADLLDARAVAGGIEFDYRSSSRAAALLNSRPERIEVDGRNIDAPVLEAGDHFTVLLPPGKRTARILIQR